MVFQTTFFQSEAAERYGTGYPKLTVTIQNSVTVNHTLIFLRFPSPGLRPPSPGGRGFVFSLALRERGRGEGKKRRIVTVFQNYHQWNRNADFAARSRRRGRARRRSSATSHKRLRRQREDCPKAAFPYRRPRTSCISYNPGFCFTTHLAALTAPWENMSLVWARWVSSMRSPMPMK